EGMEKMEQDQASQQAASGVDESECEWSEPTVSLERTGAKDQIAGYEAERVAIIATQSCKNRKTGEVCDFGLVLEQWVAPGFEAAKEVEAYYAAYAEKMGLDTSASRQFAERAQSLFGRYQGIWSEVAAKMREIDGHAVRSGFALGIGGPQCSSMHQAQQTESADSPMSIGGALGGAVGGALGGMLGKKKKEPEPAAPAAPAPTLPGGLMPMMTLSSELVSVSAAAVDPAKFEVPAGYKKAGP